MAMLGRVRILSRLPSRSPSFILIHLDDFSSMLTKAMGSQKSCSQSELWPVWASRASSVGPSQDIPYRHQMRDLHGFDNSDKRRWIAEPQHTGGHEYVTSPVSSPQPNVPRQVVVLHDHLGIPCLSGFNPLLGPQHDTSIPRFLPTSDAYSPSLRRSFFHAVHELGLNVDDFAEGTYAWVSGPTFESPAEGRFLRAAGADVVGMSTVPEILAAREEGLEVIALSLVTNSVVIPDTYRSIKDEVKTEVTAYSLTQKSLFIAFRTSFSLKGRSSRTLLKRLSLTRRSLK